MPSAKAARWDKTARLKEDKRGHHGWDFVRQRMERDQVIKRARGMLYETLEVIIGSIDFMLSVMGSHQRI